MADKFAREQIGVRDGSVPRGRLDGGIQGGNVRSFVARIDLAATGNGQVQQADNVLLAVLPRGFKFLFGILQNSASLGATAQVAIGTSKTHATNGQYRAAAIKTATTPELFGQPAALADDAVADPTPVYLTVGVADVATAGTAVITIYAAAAT